VAIDNPHLIIGNCANFLPFCNQLSPMIKVKDLLVETQFGFRDFTQIDIVRIKKIHVTVRNDQNL